MKCPSWSVHNIGSGSGRRKAPSSTGTEGIFHISYAEVVLIYVCASITRPDRSILVYPCCASYCYAHVAVLYCLNSIPCIVEDSTGPLRRCVLASLSDGRSVLVKDIWYRGNETTDACQDGEGVMNAHVLVERNLRHISYCMHVEKI